MIVLPGSAAWTLSSPDVLVQDELENDNKEMVAQSRRELLAEYGTRCVGFTRKNELDYLPSIFPVVNGQANPDGEVKPTVTFTCSSWSHLAVELAKAALVLVLLAVAGLLVHWVYRGFRSAA